jgi:CRP-like cAMP-binding protein
MFGEISMLYNTKRTANIRVKSRATCFKLDRKTFNTVVRQKNIRKRKIVMDILKKIDIFKELETEEKYQIQDVIQ